MCGRFSVSLPPEEVARYFQVTGRLPNFPPRYNMAPTQEAPVIRLNPDTAKRQLDLLRWGLVPSWAKDPKIGNKLINARAETMATKPAFKTAVAKVRRCIVPANGFFEWQKLGDRKQPMFITLKSGAPMGLAGLWENWKDPEGQWLRTFTIVTGEPNELVAPIHNRMPVILRPEDYPIWLGEKPADADALSAACTPIPAEDMRAYPISTRVNSPRNDDVGILEEVR
jgi:putative SOS response-associated peptidase YedK